jgi:hypothetical protein
MNEIGNILIGFFIYKFIILCLFLKKEKLKKNIQK